MTESNVQTWEWGRMTWLHEAHTTPDGGLSLGLVTMLPGRTQARHQHHSDDQVIYVLRGHGVHVVDDRVHACQAGDVIHIPPGASHEMANNGAADFVFLAVFTRAGVTPRVVTPVAADDPHMLAVSATVRDLAATLAAISGLSISVVDDAGAFILGPIGLPGVCRVHGDQPCAALSHRLGQLVREIRREETPRLMPCCGWLQLVVVPLVMNGAFYGAVVCGHGLLRAVDPDSIRPEVFALDQDAPAPAARAHTRDELLAGLRALPVTARSKMFHLGESLAAVILKDFETATRLAGERALLEETQKRLLLEQALHEIDLKLVQSQMNPHFLFNTLNAVVGMALLEDAPKTAEVAATLSRLLGYTLGKSERLVKVAEVVAYLESYFGIFKVRYEDKFRCEIVVESGCEAAEIPFMSLHPLVENAVVHGLERTSRPGFVAVRFKLAPDAARLVIEVENDGMAISPEALAEARRLLAVGDLTENGAGLGLKIVRRQLAHFYGADYAIVLEARAVGGTVARLDLPLRTATGVDQSWRGAGCQE